MEPTKVCSQSTWVYGEHSNTDRFKVIEWYITDGTRDELQS